MSRAGQGKNSLPLDAQYPFANFVEDRSMHTQASPKAIAKASEAQSML
jgi:hypothetical protein